MNYLDKAKALCEPQERFEEIYRPNLAKFGKMICDLSYANPYGGPPAAVFDILRESLTQNHGPIPLQYTPYGGFTSSRRIIAHDHLDRDADYDWRDVILTPGAMAALNIALRACSTTERKKVLIVTPCWLDYPLYATTLGLPYQFIDSKEFGFKLPLRGIEDALDDTVCAILLSQPANPTGVVYTESELKSLATLLETKSAPVLLISDECHRDYVPKHISLVSPTRLYGNSCRIYSFGKAHLIQGQRIGYIAVSPKHPSRESFRRDLELLTRAMGYCTPTALMQIAVQALASRIPDADTPLAARSRLVSELRPHCNLAEGDGTFFIYVKTPEDDEYVAVSALANEGVFVLPSSMFHQPGYVRIAVTGTDDMITRAIPKLVHHLKG